MKYDFLIGSAEERKLVSWFRRRLWRNYRSASGTNHWFRRRVTRPGWIVFAGIFSAGLMGVDTNLSVAYQGFVFLCFLFLFSVIASRFSGAKLLVERRLPRYGTAGSPLGYELTVTNLTARPQYGLSVLEDLPDPRPSLLDFGCIPEPGEERRNWFDRKFLVYRWRWLMKQNRQATANERIVPVLAPNSAGQVAMELLPLRRGAVRMPGVTVMCPDPIGLFRKLIHMPQPESVVILPKRYRIRSLALPGTQQYQHGGVALAASVGESEEFISLRDYRAGDPLRKIHWRSWARTGKPIVKEYVDEYFVRHGLILDTFARSTDTDEFEEAVSIAASFACSMQNQDSLLDLMFIGLHAYCFTMGRGVGHVEQLLEVLAGVKPCPDHDFVALERLILRHSAGLSGCVCVLLNWDEPRRKLVRALRATGVPVTVILVVKAGASTALDPGPLTDEPSSFHVVETGKVEEGLARL